VLALVLLLMRRLPAVAVLTDQPEVDPRPEGLLIVDELTENPVGVHELKLVLVQASAENDLTIVPVVGTVKLKVYVVVALEAAALDELRVTLRLVIAAA